MLKAPFQLSGPPRYPYITLTSTSKLLLEYTGSRRRLHNMALFYKGVPFISIPEPVSIRV
jgi:hypothetical protein